MQHHPSRKKKKKKMATNELPQVTIEDLLRMIGDREVTMARQATVIASQAARLAELEPQEAEVVK